MSTKGISRLLSRRKAISTRSFHSRNSLAFSSRSKISQAVHTALWRLGCYGETKSVLWHLKFSMFMPCSLPSNRWQDANPTLPLFMIAVRRQDRRGQGPLQGVLWLSLRNVVLSSAVSREGFLNYSSAVASLPMPPATRRISPSCRQCCRERRRRREAQTPWKMGLSWGLSLKFPLLSIFTMPPVIALAMEVL